MDPNKSYPSAMQQTTNKKIPKWHYALSQTCEFLKAVNCIPFRIYSNVQIKSYSLVSTPKSFSH